MRPLRRKRPSAPAVRLRPVELAAQLADVRALMAVRAAQATTDAEYAEWSRVDQGNLVHVRDMYGPIIWPDDPEVHEEHAENIAVLDTYHAML